MNDTAVHPSKTREQAKDARADELLDAERENGKPRTPLTPQQQILADAIAHEEAIRVEADKLWASDERGGLDELDSVLFRQLRPLLRKPIPQGFIQHVGEVTGKPYDSTGVKSVQVQMDRLDNVLGPENWGYSATYTDAGKLCYVKAWIGQEEKPLVKRDSYGGVKQGSSAGNIYKGSFTNAAKLALARLGPAWEVYVGAADFDPDTDPDAAKAQAAESKDFDPEKKLSEAAVQKLDEAITKAGIEDKHVEAKLRGFGVADLAALSNEQGVAMFAWVGEQK